jgi:hypothetical protein
VFEGVEGLASATPASESVVGTVSVEEAGDCSLAPASRSQHAGCSAVAGLFLQAARAKPPSTTNKVKPKTVLTVFIILIIYSTIYFCIHVGCTFFHFFCVNRALCDIVRT